MVHYWNVDVQTTSTVTLFSEFTVEFSSTTQLEFAECSCLLSSVVNHCLENARSLIFICSNLIPKI